MNRTAASRDGQQTPTWPDAVSCPFDFSEGLDFDPLLADLMARGPVTRVRLPYGDAEAWLVTSFAGVRRVTTDPRFSRAAIVGRDYPRLTPEPIVSPESVNVLDPPHSGRLRRAAARAFTKRRVERMTPAIERVAGRLLDGMAEHGPPADLAEHLSTRLPHHTICELLDVPPADRPVLLRRTHDLLATAPGARRAAADAKRYLRDYFAALVARRRRAPGEDLISAMAATGADDAERPLDDQELAVLAVTLILSGNDTATCQISNIAYTLLTRPGQWDELVRRPERLPGVLDELLRHIPFRKGVGIPRIALEDVEVEGVVIPAGDFVHVSYLAANRDPEVFRDPHVLDPDRPVHPHMTFGWGGHHCVAAPLALAELRVAVGTLLARFPGLRLAVPARKVRWDTATIRRFPLRLPVRW
ncbi:cytochrome P450 [Streptomyces sp. WAC05374]|uniref:cytochrome P450 n=1 Tax=Streptomyces sp. WAC05374 TaxID=2487420 RepID=UPI000F877D75|nr:cytochrome P450 [Streptomyces sp. WAC05374]RST18628.1 cytochrome P450 [Streptomyces sp. WAC05374]TDF40696.1 cytochrome P450 [Streptomyces sp. WAC05374]TDF49395.1 cytochrome P450 [Streptomyces sp. WAC05374]TDF49912.1 cytochrome P450 [Streptomyces sp. WAC05374]